MFLGEGLAAFTVAGEPQKPRQEKARLSPGRFRLCQLAAVQRVVLAQIFVDLFSLRIALSA